MTKQISIPNEAIVSKIYFIRGQKVMLDRDLAELYGVKPFRLREQVKRNIDKFSKKFMFRLTKYEAGLMVSQNAIPSASYFGGSLPYAFTEHGVLMLANVLKSKKATKISIYIIEVFVKLRELLSTNKDILLKLEQLEKEVNKNSKEIQIIFSAIKQMLNPPQVPRRKIGYKI